MIPIPTGVKDTQSWRDLQQVDQHGENLSQFEIDFIESITGQLKAGRFLSIKQKALLNRMLAEKVK